MKRRDTFRCIPFMFMAMENFIKYTAAHENEKRSNLGDKKPLAIHFTDKVKEMLTWVRINQSEKILESAHAVARTVLKGKTCWSYWDLGHTHTADLFPGKRTKRETTS